MNTPALTDLRVAIVHEWLVPFGAEKVLEHLLAIFPQADVFATVDCLPAEHRGFLRGKDVNTSFIQRLPFAKSQYRQYIGLMPLAVEGFDVSGYDLVISSSHAVAKGVITAPGQLHICYCHTPIRYAWEFHHQYLREAGMHKGLKRMLARLVLHYMRMWDLRTANNVDVFVANSRYVANRIRKTYRRSAHVIHPPVDVAHYTPTSLPREDYYLVVSRMVPYKRIPLIVEAFSRMPTRKLKVVGSGPGMKECLAVAGDNVEFLSFQSSDSLRELLGRARAFVFAAEEDFGISVVEAQACGTPVICFSKGGTRETVIPSETGIMFDEQTADSLIEAVSRFEAQEKYFCPDLIRRHAEMFSVEVFRTSFLQLVNDSLGRHREYEEDQAGIALTGSMHLHDYPQLSGNR